MLRTDVKVGVHLQTKWFANSLQTIFHNYLHDEPPVNFHKSLKSEEKTQIGEPPF